MSRGLEVMSIVPGASIQDRGRSGYLRFGVTNGGTLDQFALCEGQALLGNGPEAAALELPGFGGRFQSVGDVWVAFSGAEMALKLNGVPVAWRQSLAVRNGDVLEIGAPKGGTTGYLHVEGGFQTPRLLGSRSSHIRAGFGFAPEAGDFLPAGEQSTRSGPVSLPRPAYFDQRVFRMLRGPQTHVFAEETLGNFLATTFEITDKRDRMGARLKAQSGPIALGDGLSIASDAINHGDIQIGGDGAPVVLLSDRGSSGGYPRIGVLARADLDAFAQLPSGLEFRVELVSRSAAVDLWASRVDAMSKLPTQATPVQRDPRDIADLLSYNLVGGMVSAKEPS